MKMLITHATGNQNVRAVIAAMAGAGYLHEFNTTLSFNPQAAWLRMLPKGIRAECLRRSFPARQHQVHTHPWREIARMLFPKVGLHHFLRHETGWASIDSVYREFDKAVAARLQRSAHKHGVSLVYAYEDGALATFKQAKALGLTCVYDLPIAYWKTARRLLKEEALRLPGWALTLKGGIQDSPEKLERKTQELQLADVIVGPSSFVENSLPDWAKNKKIIMAPFGSPMPVTDKEEPTRKNFKKPLRVLFAGSMSQRKGLGDLFTAMRLLNRRDIELVVMGSPEAPMEFYRKECPHFIYEAGRPNPQVLALMRSCDVFCLPSIVEGRALVMQEAMSQGLPLIITPNTGGEDLIKQDGSTGFLIPIRSPETIAEKLNWLLDNRAAIIEMGIKAKLHAAAYTWKKYGDSIISTIHTCFC
ncbi:MAG: glycosyltransferase family 4 protein [Niastella sp.]|uniref:glycosyltransferase family 4 protein n=1 Tax=Niastella sp. TaxID=1869183 RepID=UPI00389A4E60